jgi:hypothetical protein
MNATDATQPLISDDFAATVEEGRLEVWVAQDRVWALRKRFEKLADKAGKYGIAVPEIALGECKTVKVTDPLDGSVFMVAVVKVTLNVSAVISLSGGWAFAGAIEHQLTSAVMADEGDGAHKAALPLGAPRYTNLLTGGAPATLRHAEPLCEHCGMVRARKQTFLIRAADGTVKRVGRSCLHDYLGRDPRDVLAAFGFLADAAQALGAEQFMGHAGSDRDRAFSLIRVLELAALGARISPIGFVSRKKARETGEQATADRVLVTILKGVSVEVEPEDTELAERALEWAKGLPLTEGEEKDNDFLGNLRVIASAAMVPARRFGLVCAMIAAYQRAVREAARIPSTHFGTVGVRYGAGKGAKAVPPIRATLRKVTGYESYGFGYISILIFATAEGQELVWKTGSPGDVLEGAEYIISAGVTAHDVSKYTGEPVTMISRCKLERVKA